MSTDLKPSQDIEAAADVLAVTPREKIPGAVPAFIMRT